MNASNNTIYSNNFYGLYFFVKNRVLQDLSGAWVTVLWVRANQGICLSGGSDRGEFPPPPDQIQIGWFHASFSDNPRKESRLLDASPPRGRAMETSCSRLIYEV
jgi:hypothetical protein